MGTDVHSVFQKKTADGWVDVESNYGEERHYALFGWIGNVRSRIGIEPLSDRRGFPDDFAVTDGEDHGNQWMGEHSHSWLTADEILNAMLPLVVADDESKPFDYFIDEVRRLKELYGEARFVFGFDS